ncbi:MAG: DUF3141 domain-containing protein, partial [Pseudomonadota bacterium]
MPDNLNAADGNKPDRAIEFMFDSVAKAVSKSPEAMLNRQVEAASDLADGLQATQNFLLRTAMAHGARISRDHQARFKDAITALSDLAKSFAQNPSMDRIGDAWQAYLKDSTQRAVLTLDTLRERGDMFLEHEAAGCPPVLTYDYEVIVDGADLPYPCNYMLLKILPPEGIAIDEA